MNRFLLPLGAFALIAVLLWRGLDLDPRELPSTLIDKPAPAFLLESLSDPANPVSVKQFEGKVWLLNVWASWCVACLHEHPIITTLSDHIDIVGLNYKDKRQDALQWLEKHGNPYLTSGFDEIGDVGIDYGVYGVPETFVIDQKGHIRFKHIGPVTAESMTSQLLPVIQTLRESVN